MKVGTALALAVIDNDAEEDVVETSELFCIAQDSVAQYDHGAHLPGTRAAPRLRRGLHFPVNHTPRTPALDDTLTADPLPSVPEAARNDPLIQAALQSKPELFGVSTPFRVNALARMLEPHPNRPFVESVLEGLKTGFWPGHHGNFSPTTPAPRLQQSDEDLDFIRDSTVKDFKKGYLSSPFYALLPGMVVSPTHVVRLDGRKPRLVVDQSTSGLNDGVDRNIAKTVYDTVRELGALMRFRRLRGEDSSEHILWKSDVSGAFRNLPVAPEWQVKQVHRVRLRDCLDRHTWVYYVDRRLMLGGRLSPRIWCSVINLVLWGVRYSTRLEFPLIFVDDAFGFQVSGGMARATHPESGESRLVPIEQARLLFIWNHCGVPWDWSKQLWSSESLEVLGHVVSATELTVTLPHSKKLEFAGKVHLFLSARFDPPLIEWQRIAGYAQWACYSNPFAKFALHPLYAKMSGKIRRNAPVPINKDVRTNLSWFVAEILEAPPLSFHDPALEEWSQSDADTIAYTDACLTSDNGQSGLGFWIAPGSNNSDCCLSFFHRAFTPLPGIQLAEALAVCAAIEHVVTAYPDARRVLVFTDSGPCVYAFDAARGSPALLNLAQATWDRLHRLGVDLRIRHIRGAANGHADHLSRWSPDRLAHSITDLSLFSPPAWALSIAFESFDAETCSDRGSGALPPATSQPTLKRGSPTSRIGGPRRRRH